MNLEERIKTTFTYQQTKHQIIINWNKVYVFTSFNTYLILVRFSDLCTR